MKIKYFLLVFFISGLVHPQSPNEILKRIQSKFTSIKDFSASFNQVLFSNTNSNSGKTTGKFFYKKKNKFFVELKKQTIISDGETVWSIDQKFNRVVISYLRDDPTTFSVEKFIFDYPPLCKVKLLKDINTKAGELILELNPKDNDLQFKSIKIWATSDNFISKMELIDIADMKYIIELYDVLFNINFTDNKFVFYPQKGMQVIDIR